MIGTLDLETDAPSMNAPDVTSQTFAVLQSVARERQCQDAAWGEQRHSPGAWLAILMEEVGEAAKEIAESTARPLDREAFREELIQVAAVAIAAVESLDFGAALGRAAPRRDIDQGGGWQGSIEHVAGKGGL